jgi:hypothetical protein
MGDAKDGESVSKWGTLRKEPNEVVKSLVSAWIRLRNLFRKHTKDDVRHQRTLPFLESLFRDIRLGFRILAADRALSVIAIIALTLGIGASTIIFSVIYSVFVDALPIQELQSPKLGAHLLGRQLEFGRTGCALEAQRLTDTSGRASPWEEKGIGKFKTSQASDVGSIPIARSINPVDAVEFTGFPHPNSL